MDIFSDIPAASSPDWARLLPGDVFAEVILALRAALPPPILDEPAEWDRRDRAAMAAVGVLAPETAVEARLAAQFVASDAFALDCLRRAQEKRREPDTVKFWASQGIAMMRESKSALRLLMSVQAQRRKAAQDAVAVSRAEWAEHVAVNMMAETLADVAARAVVVPVVAPVRGSKLGLGSDRETGPRKTRCETAARLRPVPVVP